MNSKITTNERVALLQAFGDNLKSIRESKEMTQEALAFTAGFSRSYYTEVEQGKRNLSLVNISRLAKALNIPITQLLSF